MSVWVVLVADNFHFVTDTDTVRGEGDVKVLSSYYLQGQKHLFLYFNRVRLALVGIGRFAGIV